MNILDLIICLVLALAVWNGWRRGFILQICSLAALIVALWLAARFASEVGAMLHIEEAYAQPAGFVVVLVAALIVLALAARLLRKIFHFAGFGILDTLLGILVAAVKYLLVLSVVFVALDRINVDHALVPAETISSSRGYKPVRDFSSHLLPFVGWVGEQVDELQNSPREEKI